MSVEGRPLDHERDDDLIRRARDGDIGAYEDLVRRYQAVAVRVASVVAGPADAEDAVQEAFVRAYGALGRFRVGEPFRPWVLRIVVNQSRNRRRSASRREQLALRVAVRPSGDAAPSPEGAAIAGDERRTLLDALDRLPDRERLVIACRYLAELSESETAAALGVPAGTVKSRLARGLAKLRAALESPDD
jgi:RNA polymerase sigma factor (sigma-70 family)